MTPVPKLHQLALCTLLGLLCAPVLRAADCAAALREAHGSYDLGRFEAVPGELAPCLQGKVSRQETVQANALLAKAFLALDREAEARVAIARLVKADPSYEPDEPPLLVRMVKEARRLAASRQVASVSKTAETLREAPATVEVVTGDEIRRRGYLDLEQVLHDLPGFDISRDNGQVYSTFYQRGFRSNNTDRNLLLVDGMEQNDLATNVVYLSRQYPLSNVDRIEVLYGPASTLYGSNAYTGVINIITRDPEALIPEGRRLGYSAEAGGGSFSTRYADATFAGRDAGGAVAWSLTARSFHSAEMDLSRFSDWDFDLGSVDYSARFELTGAAARSFVGSCTQCDPSLFTTTVDSSGQVTAVQPTAEAVKLARRLDQQLLNQTSSRFADPTDDWSVDGRLRLGGVTFGFQLWQLREGIDPWYPESLAGGRGESNLWQPRQASFFFRTARPLSPDLTLQLSGRYLETTLSSRQTLFGTYAGGLSFYELVHSCSMGSCTQPSSTVVTSSDVSSEVRTDATLLYQPLGRLSAAGGIELRRSSIEGVPELHAQGFGTRSRATQAEHTDVAVYAQGSYGLSDRLKLVAGGRLDHSQISRHLVASSGFGSLFSSRVALIYTPRPSLVLKAIYSDAFKDPSDFEKFGTVSISGVSTADLHPETVKNYEISAGWQPTAGTSFTGSVYQARYHDAVTLASSFFCFLSGGCLPISTLSNAGEYRIRGLQAGARYRLGDIDLDANYTFTQPLDLSPASGTGSVRIADISSHRVNLGAGIPLGHKLDLSLRTEYVGARRTGSGTSVPDNPLREVPATFLAHAALSLTELIPGTTLQLVVRNLFDRAYYDPGVQGADGIAFASRVPQPGRTVYLRLLTTADRSRETP